MKRQMLLWRTSGAVQGCYNHNVVVVLGSSSDEGDAAYVDFFYDVSVGCSGCHSGFKRIQVDYHQVDFGYFILSYLLTVAFIFATVEYSAEYFGMQRLHTSAEYRRVAGKILYSLTTVA